MSSPDSAFISLQDICIRAGEQRFFDHATWNLEKGQHWAVWGPSGSGKSILGKALDHSLPLLRGQILYHFGGPPRPYLNPHEVLTFSAETHRAFLRQFADYYQARWQSFEGQDAPSVADLLDSRSLQARSPFEVLSPGQVEVLQRRQHEVMNLFDLSDLLPRKVHLLSHGESRKVFLARLLLQTPQLLILDDPFTGLDEESRARFRDGIGALFQSNQTAILLITSRAGEIPTGVTHILKVESSHIADQGPREDVLSRAARLDRTPAREIPVSDHTDIPGHKPTLHRMVEQYATALQGVSLIQPPDQVRPDLVRPDLVRMENVSVTYGDTTLLKDITWTVRQGERWALLGANGAGKSTLLSLILADNPQAYRNSIFLFGQKRGSGESIWEIKQRIGWVSPELQIFYDKTVSCQEVIASGFFDSVGLYHSYSKEQAAAVQGWASAFGIEPLLNWPFQSLSTGQQRLALLSRAITKNPPLLILDEPCQGLDDDQRAHFIRQIEYICDRVPLTMIYVTHYREEIPKSIRHILRLSRGEIQEIVNKPDA